MLELSRGSLDHAGGSGGLMQHFPNATLLVHKRGYRHLIDPAKLEQGSLAVYGEEAFESMYGRLIPVAAERVQVAEDGFELNFNGRKLLFIDTPGHARHHYCVYDEMSQGLFSGDTFGASYPELNTGKNRFIFPPTTPIQFDPRAWYTTLDKLMALPLERIYVTYFGMHEDIPPLHVMLRQAIEDYAATALKFAASADREAAIEDSLLQSSVGYFLEQQCLMQPDRIKSLFAQDMQLNAQGLDFWLGQQ